MFRFSLKNHRAWKIVAGIIIAGLVIEKVDISLFRTTLKNIDHMTILKSLGFIYASFAFMSIRWQEIIEPRNQSKHFLHIPLYWKSCFYNTFTPGNIGGDAYRTVVLRRLNFRIDKIVRFLIEERSIGLYGYIITMFVCSVILLESSAFYSLRLIQISASISSCAIALGVIVTIVSKWKYKPLSEDEALFDHSDESKLKCEATGAKKRLYYAYELVLSLCCLNKRLILYILTILSIVFWGLAVNTIGMKTGLGASFTQVLLSVVITEFARLIPITPQGLGIREAVFVYVLQSFKCSDEISLATIGTSYLLLTFVLVTTWPIGWLLLKMSK